MHANLCLLRKLNVCGKWSEDQSTLTLIYKVFVGATDQDKASLLRKILSCEIQVFKCFRSFVIAPQTQFP